MTCCGAAGESFRAIDKLSLSALTFKKVYEKILVEDISSSIIALHIYRRTPYQSPHYR